MPDRNVEIVRRVLDAFDRREVDVFIENMTADVTFFAPTAAYAGHGGQIYRGYDGIHAYFHDVSRTWDELQIDPREYREGENGCVAVIGSVAGRLKTGDSVESQAGWAFRVDEDGKIVWGRAYTNPSEALADVGLAS